MAQLPSAPAATYVAFSMGTITGTSLSVVVPLPSAPNVLSPQHQTVPFDSSAQAWK